MHAGRIQVVAARIPAPFDECEEYDRHLAAFEVKFALLMVFHPTDASL
jgi:hypothetical protein